MRESTLLTVDAIINLLLGAVLIFFPSNLVALLGVPTTEVAFYPSILGAVLFGIGVALLLERFGRDHVGSGLGLGGAIAINLSGALVLGAWLVFGDLGLPVRGLAFLWGLVVVLLVVSAFELRPRSRSTRGSVLSN